MMQVLFFTIGIRDTVMYVRHIYQGELFFYIN